MRDATASGRPATGWYGTPIWRALDRYLDALPWPWGEEIMAALGVARGLVVADRRRAAFRWASRHRSSVARRSGLALALLANDGRFKAMDALLGIRDAALLNAHLTIEGAERLQAVLERGPAIVVAFHLGPSLAGLALRAKGYPLTPLFGAGRSDRDRRADSRLGLDPDTAIRVPLGSAEASAAHLNVARRLLNEGRSVIINADGRHGKEAFRVDIPGSAVIVRSGWLTLRRLTRAVAVPALIRREGRQLVVAVHPPLPDPDPDATRDLEACRAALSPIVQDYVRRFPEQCPFPALGGSTP